MNLTIFSDASHCSETLAAGGAYWSRTSNLYFNDAFEVEGATCAFEAEAITLVVAMESILKNELLQKAVVSEGGWEKTLLILVVDCIGLACLVEKGPIKSKRPIVIKAIERARKALKACPGLRVRINHVRAHSGVSTARQWVNDWCDKQSRSFMQTARTKRLAAGVLASKPSLPAKPNKAKPTGGGKGSSTKTSLTKKAQLKGSFNHKAKKPPRPSKPRYTADGARIVTQVQF